MSSDPLVNLNLAASQLDPSLIQQVQGTGSFELPDLSGSSNAPAITIVRVPDLNQESTRAQTDPEPKARPSKRSDQSVNQPQDTMQSSRFRDAAALIRPNPVGTIEVAKQISAGVDAQIAELPLASKLEVSGELSEKPSDWMGGTSGKNDDKDRNTTKSEALDVNEEAIEKLTAQILERFPLASPATLLFAGVENLVQVDEACAQVARKLAEKNIGKILLIDSEFEQSSLTSASGTSSLIGLRNVLLTDEKWKDAVIEEGRTPMDFLSVGNKSLQFWDAAIKNKCQLIAEMKGEYQFICISAGDAHSDAASFWADVSDGTFLVVSLEKTSQTLAFSSVDQLRCNGARVLGCIVADSPGT